MWTLLFLLAAPSTAQDEDSDIDEIWFMNPENISVPNYRLRAIKPSSPHVSTMIFSCSAATGPTTLANLSWELEFLEGTTVLSIDTRRGSYDSVTVVDSLLTISPPKSRHPGNVCCRIAVEDGGSMLLKVTICCPRSWFPSENYPGL